MMNYRDTLFFLLVLISRSLSLDNKSTSNGFLNCVYLLKSFERAKKIIISLKLIKTLSSYQINPKVKQVRN